MPALNLDSSNSEHMGTTLNSTGSAIALRVNSPNSGAISGATSSGIGVMGQTYNWLGVFGQSTQGTAILGQGDVGVVGWGNQRGMAGWASYIGVIGGARFGVLGDSTSENGAGVFGTTKNQTYYGAVHGLASQNAGVIGASKGSSPYSNTGVIGYSVSGIGVVGITDSPTPSSTVCGGYFIGGLVVSGGVKAAAVPHTDGMHRMLYTMESPESWFEDFGRASLEGGRARVALDDGFAAVVETDDYHVFLSPEGESAGLHVSRRGRTYFDVRENQRGKSNVTFSYRLVARRKDVEAPRLQKVKLPDYAREDMVSVPKDVSNPEPPDLRGLPRMPRRAGGSGRRAAARNGATSARASGSSTRATRGKRAR